MKGSFRLGVRLLPQASSSGTHSPANRKGSFRLGVRLPRASSGTHSAHEGSPLTCPAQMERSRSPRIADV